MNATAHHRSGSSFGWRALLVVLFFAIVGGFLLSAEHRAHAVGILPFLLILLLCPLMHMFMHGGHGGHEPEDAADGGTTADRERPLTGAASPHGH